MRAQMKTMDKAKNVSLHDTVIHVINKYSLSTYYVPGTVVSALEQNRQRKGLLSYSLHSNDTQLGYTKMCLSHSSVSFFMPRPVS